MTNQLLNMNHYFESFIQSNYNTDLKSYKEACSMSDKDWDDDVKKAMKAKMIPFCNP